MQYPNVGIFWVSRSGRGGAAERSVMVIQQKYSRRLPCMQQGGRQLTKKNPKSHHRKISNPLCVRRFPAHAARNQPGIILLPGNFC